MRLFLTLLILTALSGCIKEKITSFLGVFENNTSQTIEVRTFRNGQNTPTLTVTIPPNSEGIFADGFRRGLNDINSGFNSESFGGGDSVHVVFNGSVRMVHYGANVGGSIKRYENTHPRSLFNSPGWLYTTLIDKKHVRMHEYRFTFIDQDYLDAQ